MLVVDRSCDISFGTYDCFFKRCIVCMFIEHIVLTFVHQQIRLGIETQGSGFIDEMNAGMKISGCNFCLLFALPGLKLNYSVRSYRQYSNPAC